MDPVSMYCMGEIDFQVIPTNVPRALELFKKAADKGYPQAQATIGALYLKGLPGVLEKDHKKGITLLSKAVRSKSLTARFNLGMAYYNGDGVSKDPLKASQWLRIAERQNFSEAQYTLGLLLLEGSGGIEKNTSEGLSLLRKAASQEHQLAILYLKNGKVREGQWLSSLRLPAMPLEKPTLWMTVRLWSEQDNITQAWAKPRIMRRLIVFFFLLLRGAIPKQLDSLGL